MLLCCSCLICLSFFGSWPGSGAFFCRVFFDSADSFAPPAHHVCVDDARAILSSQTLSYRATFVEKFPVVVEQARHPAYLWPKYFDLDVDKLGADVL